MIFLDFQFWNWNSQAMFTSRTSTPSFSAIHLVAYFPTADDTYSGRDFITERFWKVEQSNNNILHVHDCWLGENDAWNSLSTVAHVWYWLDYGNNQPTRTDLICFSACSHPSGVPTGLTRFSLTNTSQLDTWWEIPSSFPNSKMF